jgi:hypothetical protein
MGMTATDLRKKLFPMLDSVAGGNPVEFNYKGKQMRIVADAGTAKLARLRPQTYTLVSEREMESDAADMSGKLQADWLAKWDK